MSSKKYRANFLIVWGRIIAHAGQNMWRNASLALVTITILVLSLISVNALLAVRAATTAAVTAVNKQVDLSLFFEPAAPEKTITDIVAYLQAVPNVTSVEYTNPDQALAAFRARHANNDEILKSLDVLGENPLGALVVVHAGSAGDYPAIISLVQAQPWNTLIQQRSFEDKTQIASRVELLTSRARTGSIVLAILFSLIAIMIIFNTVRVAIYTQRDEIAIKKLVGATNGFIRAPFFVEGFVYVVIACAVVIGLLAATARVVDPFLGPLFSDGGFSLHTLFFAAPYELLVAETIIVLLLTWITSAFAMRRYLRT